MRRRTPRNPIPVALGLLAVIVIGSFLAVTKDIPFLNEPYEVKAAFRDSTGIKKGSPVRIAGVEVGRVTAVEPTSAGARSAVLTLAIREQGRPIKRDAAAKIRPRIFLEGNYFVELSPGRPGTAELAEGAVIPVDRTSTPVLLDDVLKALKSDVRADLRQTFYELSNTQLQGGGKALNRSLRDQPAAYKYSAIVAEALLGEKPHDLGKYLRAQGTVSEALDADPRALQDLITNFNRTAGALAERESDLRAGLRELPVTLRTALPTLSALNAAFPSVRSFARSALPGIRSTGPAIDAALPLVRQLRGLVGANELRGLSQDLRAATPSLAGLTRTAVPLLGELRAFASCTNEVLVPFGNSKLTDPNFPATGPVYQELPKSLVGLAGESRSFDANGQWFKVLGSGGTETVSLGNGLLGQTSSSFQGVNPPAQIARPPLRPDAPCENQAAAGPADHPGAGAAAHADRPELGAGARPRGQGADDGGRGPARRARGQGLEGEGARRGRHPRRAARRHQGPEGGPMILTLRKNVRYIVALLGLAAIALAVASYILKEQGVRIPFASEGPVRISAVLDNAQAVTPGQGQTVQVAGVQVGKIATVELEEGRAKLGLDIEPKFMDSGLIKTDATALLRPRTPLKDMYLQVFPGKRDGTPIRKGFELPLRNTMTDVDLDEILSALDGRTRDYLTLLVNGAGNGLKDRGGDLAEVFRRFEPTVRDLARVNRSVAGERVALRRLVSSLAGLNGKLAERPQDLSQLVTASNATFGAFASEDQNLKATVSELPATLSARPGRSGTSSRWPTSSGRRPGRSPRRCRR